MLRTPSQVFLLSYPSAFHIPFSVPYIIERTKKSWKRKGGFWCHASVIRRSAYITWKQLATAERKDLKVVVNALWKVFLKDEVILWLETLLYCSTTHAIMNVVQNNCEAFFNWMQALNRWGFCSYPGHSIWDTLFRHFLCHLSESLRVLDRPFFSFLDSWIFTDCSTCPECHCYGIFLKRRLSISLFGIFLNSHFLCLNGSELVSCVFRAWRGTF